jgi:diguanylate cyclase (GGDEF)-like protein
MPSPNRATRAPAPRPRASGPWRARTTLDLAARLRIAERSLRRRLERRQELIDVMDRVDSSLEPRDIASALIERAATWIPATSWWLASADPSGHISFLAEETPAAHLTAAVHAVARWVMDRGEHFATADLRRDARVRSEVSATVIAFPLISREASVGALVAAESSRSSKEPKLTQATLKELRILLNPVASALDKVLLLKRAEALSVTDDLTQLYNSRYLNQVLRRETKRAARSGRPLSLLFVDLDGFKTINDTHGHLFGSRALVEAASVIQGGARETDVVARFGGDEFALVLPDTGLSGAVAVAERIRERIAAHEFLATDGLAIRLTASVGVASLPDMTGSADGLVQAADAAMYQVKARGKNGIQAGTVPADK